MRKLMMPIMTMYIFFIFLYIFLVKIPTNMSDANNETAAVTQPQQQSPSQNGKERSKSTEEKEIPREPALVCKDINVSDKYVFLSFFKYVVVQKFLVLVGRK